MSAIKWTKSFDAFVNRQHFRVHVSEQEGGLFSASCLYYELEGGRMLGTPGNPGKATFKLETKAANDPDMALNELLAWAESKFNVTMELKPAS